MEPATPATATRADILSRFFSWAMLAFLAAYLINNTLNHAAQWPGVTNAFSSAGGWQSWVQILIYCAALWLAWL